MAKRESNLALAMAVNVGVVRPNPRKFRQAVCDNISGSNRIESTIWGGSSTPAEIYSKPLFEPILRVIFHQKTAKNGI